MNSYVQQIGPIVSNIKNDPSLVAKINLQTDLINEIGLDSLEMIDFLLELETVFQISIDFNTIEIGHLESVERLCAFIDNARATAPAS